MVIIRAAKPETIPPTRKALADSFLSVFVEFLTSRYSKIKAQHPR
jgi:hypothetical protein